MKNSLRPVRLQVYSVVLVCTPEQWSDVQKQFPNSRPGVLRGRHFLSRNFGTKRVVFLNSGDGVVAAASAAQFAIDRWNPTVLMSTSSREDCETAVVEVCEINGIRLLPEPVVATNIEDSVPEAIAAANKANG